MALGLYARWLTQSFNSVYHACQPVLTARMVPAAVSCTERDELTCTQMFVGAGSMGE